MRKPPLAAISLFFVILVSMTPPARGRDVDSPLYRHLLDEAKSHLLARSQEVGSLIEPASLEARRDWVRDEIVKSFGGFPEKTPLNGKTLWTKSFDGYTVEGVIYESKPGLFVTANLYIPSSGTPPFPAILGPCGHSSIGKAADTYQSAWINLAKRGFVVLSFDPVGQGERMAYLDKEGKARYGPTTEHTMLGVQALLVGTNIARDFIWDGIRSIDYLVSRPEVDSERVGCTGNSGGGTQTSYFMAIDRRIAAAAPSCYITSLEKLYSTIGPQDAEQNFIGQTALGIDHADYVEACLPRPVLICAASDDFFDIDGTWATFREAKNFYQRYGIPERVDLIEAPDNHGFSKPRRTAVYHWMERWLMGGSDYKPEPETPLNQVEDLLCVDTGQVNLSIPGAKSLRDFYGEDARSLKEERRKKDVSRDVLHRELKRVIRLQETSSPIQWEREQEVVQSGAKKELLKTEIEPGWFLEGDLLKPEEISSGHVVLLLEDILTTPVATDKIVEKGIPVFTHYPRGLSAEDRLQGNSLYRYFGDYPLYFLALHLNRPLIGQRVGDVLACIDFLVDEFPGKEIRVISNGRAVPVALIAAVLDDRVSVVEAKGGLITWESIFEATFSRDCLSNVAPGILEVADLPDLVAAIQPRQVTLQSSLSPEGEVLEVEEAQTAYEAVLGEDFSRMKNLKFLGAESE